MAAGAAGDSTYVGHVYMVEQGGLCGTMFAGVAPPVRAVTPASSEWEFTSTPKAVPRALGAQSGAHSPSYPFVHPSSMLEQLVDEDQHNGSLAREAQPVATMPTAPKCPAPAGWELVM